MLTKFLTKISNFIFGIKPFLKNKFDNILNYFGSIRQDLVWHQYISFFIFIVTFGLLHKVCLPDVTIVLSAILTISAGLFKEGVIDMYLRGGEGNRDDVIHNLIGVALGILTGFLFL